MSTSKNINISDTSLLHTNVKNACYANGFGTCYAVNIADNFICIETLHWLPISQHNDTYLIPVLVWRCLLDWIFISTMWALLSCFWYGWPPSYSFFFPLLVPMPMPQLCSITLSQLLAPPSEMDFHCCLGFEHLRFTSSLSLVYIDMVGLGTYLHRFLEGRNVNSWKDNEWMDVIRFWYIINTPLSIIFSVLKCFRINFSLICSGDLTAISLNVFASSLQL